MRETTIVDKRQSLCEVLQWLHTHVYSFYMVDSVTTIIPLSVIDNLNIHRHETTVTLIVSHNVMSRRREAKLRKSLFQNNIFVLLFFFPCTIFLFIFFVFEVLLSRIFVSIFFTVRDSFLAFFLFSSAFCFCLFFLFEQPSPLHWPTSLW